MPAEWVAEGITPEMVRIGLLARDVSHLSDEARRIQLELGRTLDAMAPVEMAGEPVGNDVERAAYWKRLEELVDQAQRAREEAGDGS